MMTYELIQKKGGAVEAIQCLICGRISHNPHDVAQLFCGNCRVFHNGDPAARVALPYAAHAGRDPAEVAAERQFLGIVEEELNRCLGFGGALTMGSSIARAANGVLTMDKLIETYRLFFELHGERVWHDPSGEWRCPMCKAWWPHFTETCQSGCGITRGPEPAGGADEAVRDPQREERQVPKRRGDDT